MRKQRFIGKGMFGLALALLGAVAVLGGRPGVGELFYEGQVVRTIVPPAAMKKVGIDNLYPVMDGVEGQRPVAAVALPAPRSGGEPPTQLPSWVIRFQNWLSALR